MKRILFSLLLGVVFVPFCMAQDEDVRVNADKDTDFSQYKTYYWSSALDEITDSNSSGIDSETSEKLKKTITTKMEAMGYTLSEDDPDLLVNFYSLTKDTTQATDQPEFPDLGYSFWWGPDWYDRGNSWTGWDFWVNGSTYWFYGNPTFKNESAEVTTRHPGPGTLFIDVIDNEKNMLVWEGYISDEVPQNTETGMEEDVKVLLDEFPQSKDQG